MQRRESQHSSRLVLSLFHVTEPSEQVYPQLTLTGNTLRDAHRSVPHQSPRNSHLVWLAVKINHHSSTLVNLTPKDITLKLFHSISGPLKDLCLSYSAKYIQSVSLRPSSLNSSNIVQKAKFKVLFETQGKLKAMSKIAFCKIKSKLNTSRIQWQNKTSHSKGGRKWRHRKAEWDQSKTETHWGRR